MSVYTVRQNKIITLTLIFIMGIFLLYSLHILFAAILGAIILYELFKPMYIYLAEKRKLYNSVSAAAVIVVSIIIIVIPFTSLILMLKGKIQYYASHPEIINKIVSSVENFIGQIFDQGTVKDTLNKAGGFAMGLLTSFFDSAVSLLLTVSMMYFFLYFMFTKHEVFEGTLIKYMPFRETNSRHFADELKNMTFANVVGQGIIAFAQGLFLGIGFIIFGLPDPFFWAVICFFVSFLPVIGSAAVFVPAGVISIASGDNFGGIGILLYGFIVVSNVDNLLRLWINKWLGDIHPLITITGIVIGIPVFGILGIVFGPLLISIFILLIRMYEAAYADSVSEKERIVKEEEV